MKKAILASVAALWLFTGATCSSTDISALIEQVQAATSQACKFVPTVNTILALFNLKDPNIVNAQQFADAICKEVAGSAARMGAPAGPAGGKMRVGTVRGVDVDGYRTH